MDDQNNFVNNNQNLEDNNEVKENNANGEVINIGEKEPVNNQCVPEVKIVEKPVYIPVENNKKPKRTRKKHYWWRYLLCFIAGDLFCVLATAGGVVLSAMYVKPSEVLDTIGYDSPYYINEKYADDSLFSFVMKFANKEITINKIGDVADLSPALKEQVIDPLIDQVNDIVNQYTGYKFSESELLATDFSGLGDYLTSSISSGAKLVNLLQNFAPQMTSNEIFTYLLYETDSNGNFVLDDNGDKIALTIKGLDDGFQTKLNTMTLGSILPSYFEPGGSLEKLSVLKDAVLLASDTDPNSLMNKLMNTKLSAILGNVSSNKLIQGLMDKTINELTSADMTTLLGDFTIGDVAGVYAVDADGEYILDGDGNKTFVDGTSSILKSLAPTTLSDLMSSSGLQRVFDSLTIGDLVGDADSNPVINALKDKTISQLTDASLFDSIKVGTLLGVFEDDGTTIKSGTSSMIASLANLTLSELTAEDGLDDLLISDFIGGDSTLATKVLDGITVGQLRKGEFDLTSVKIGSLFTDSEIAGSSVLTALKDLSIGDLTSSDGLNDIKISAFLEGADTTSAVYKLINDKTIGDLKNGDISFDSIKISDLGLAKGQSKIIDALIDGNVTISELPNYIENTLTIDDVIDLGSNLNFLSGTTIGGLSEKMSNITFKDVVGDTDNALLKSLADTKVFGDNLADTISNKVNDLKLSELMTIDSSSPYVLQSIKDVKISELSDTFSTLTIGKVIDFDSLDSGSILKNIPQNTTIDNLGSAVNDIKFCDAFASEIFTDPEDKTTVKGVWKIMLKDPATGSYNYDYTIGSDLGRMVSNMTSNMQTATLNELNDMGLLDSSCAASLDKTIFGQSKKIGEMTISEILGAISTYSN